MMNEVVFIKFEKWVHAAPSHPERFDSSQIDSIWRSHRTSYSALESIVHPLILLIKEYISQLHDAWLNADYNESTNRRTQKY
jgi:hypothetical protein